MNGPEQVPDNGEHSASDFEEFMNHSLPEKTSTFKYQDSTSENINSGESQHFSYGSNDLPEKE